VPRIPTSACCRLAAACALLPVGALVYVFYAAVAPAPRAGGPEMLTSVFQALLILTLLGVGTGAAVVWRCSGTLSRTIEEQREEIATSAQRFDAAYRELETANSRLKEFSFKDEITGLYNRRFFTIRLDEEVNRYRRYRRPMAVVLLDLDGFKAVNDRMGHAAGDETLRDVAHVLSKHSRDTNVVCRFGGDEFAVLLVETSGLGARLYADRLRQLIAAYPFAHGCRVSASFGVASVPDEDAESSEEIVRCADEALYAAKRAGKNTVCARGDMRAEREAVTAGGRSS
jgi:diguanylate cyclase (GGDEF)-like protein